MQQKYDIAAYYWPAYHDEPRWRRFMPEGKGEWETVRKAKPKFPGHWQPRVPAWGETDESDPAIMARKIDLAANHGVNVFIFDWYWYENEPFLEEALNRGYLAAPNNDKVKFYIMWANHGATTAWDLKHAGENRLVFPGQVDLATFERATDRLINRYFGHPSYYKIDGKPVLSIYEIGTLMYGLGGLDATRAAIDGLRNRVVKAGFTGLHLQGILWGNLPASISMVPGDRAPTQGKTVETLGIDSLTNYQWCHYVHPDGPYQPWAEKAIAAWDKWADEFPVPFYPHVSVSWDTNSRFPGLCSAISGSTPELFGTYLRKAMDFVDARRLSPRLITVNAWNEWSEASYLEPDTVFGTGYVEAIRAAMESR